MAPAAIVRKMDQLKRLVEAQTEAWMTGNTRTALDRQARAGVLRGEVAAALKASSYWADDVKASLLRQIGAA